MVINKMNGTGRLFCLLSANVNAGLGDDNNIRRGTRKLKTASLPGFRGKHAGAGTGCMNL